MISILQIYTSSFSVFLEFSVTVENELDSQGLVTAELASWASSKGALSADSICLVASAISGSFCGLLKSEGVSEKTAANEVSFAEKLRQNSSFRSSCFGQDLALTFYSMPSSRI